MDLSQKESLSEEISDMKKYCTVCKTTKTPLWRGGPAGPKSLCNACGIKYRKRRAIMGLNKGTEKKKERAHTSTAATSVSVASDLRVSLKMGLVALGKEVVLLQKQRSSTAKRQRRKMGEEEQAAVLLMALSCGSVFA